MISSQHFFRIFSLVVVLALTACGKKAPDGPSSTTLERAGLMQLAFPGWKTNTPRQWQQPQVPGAQTNSTDAKGDAVETGARVLVEPEFVVRLSDDDATLIVRSNGVDVNGNIDDCWVCMVSYGAIQFHRYDGNWYLSNREDDFEYVGQKGAYDFREIVKLSQHAYALKLGGYYATVEDGDENDDKIFNLYELTPTGPRPLLEKRGSYLSSYNPGLGSRCEPPASKDANQALTEEEQSPCHKIDSKWKIDSSGETPGDLTMQFSGFDRAPDKIAPDKDARYRYLPVSARQTWHYQNGKYVLASGRNPIDALRQ